MNEKIFKSKFKTMLNLPISQQEITLLSKRAADINAHIKTLRSSLIDQKKLYRARINNAKQDLEQIFTLLSVQREDRETEVEGVYDLDKKEFAMYYGTQLVEKRLMKDEEIEFVINQFHAQNPPDAVSVEEKIADVVSVDSKRKPDVTV